MAVADDDQGAEAQVLAALDDLRDAVDRDDGVLELELGRVIILEFPTYEDAKTWYSSVEYEVIKLLRQGAAVGELILVEGV